MRPNPRRNEPMSAAVIVYCINLSDGAERRAFMQAQFDRLSLPVQFIEAVSGESIEPDEVEQYDRRRRRALGADLAPNEIACALSHVKALATFLASDYPYAVVLEDDVRIADDFECVVCDLVKQEPTWDNARLALGEKNRRPWKIAPVNADRDLVIPLNATKGLLGVLYTRAGAAKALKSLSSFYLPADTHLGETYRNGLMTVAVSPPLVEEQALASAIGARRATGETHGGNRSRIARGRWRRFERSVGKRLYAAYTWVLLKNR